MIASFHLAATFGNETVPARSPQLPFLEHVDQFNSSQRDLCGPKTLESQHRATLAFDAPMILFNDVVEVLALPDLDTLVVIIIVAFDRSCIRTTFVDIDEPRFSIP